MYQHTAPLCHSAIYRTGVEKKEGVVVSQCTNTLSLCHGAIYSTGVEGTGGEW